MTEIPVVSAQAYFGGCPIVSVPGFTHPIQDVYLEEVLHLTGHQPEGAALMSRPTEGGRGRTGRGPPGRGRGPGRGMPGRGAKHVNGAGPAAPPLPPHVAAEVEEAILQSFLQVSHPPPPPPGPLALQACACQATTGRNSHLTAERLHSLPAKCNICSAVHRINCTCCCT